MLKKGFCGYRLLGCLLLLLVACTAPALEDTKRVDKVLKGSVFDSRTGQVIEGAVVTVGGERIICVGSARECPWPKSAQVLEVEEGTILPGLIDAHVHSRGHYAGAYPGAGVTTVRDGTSPVASARAVQAAAIRPRIINASPMIDSADSRLAPFGVIGGPLEEIELDSAVYIVIEDRPGAEALLAALAETPITWLKVYDRISPAGLAAVMGAARGAGTPVMADLGLLTGAALQGQVDIVDAALAGVDSIEHLSGLALAYQRRGGDPMTAVDVSIIDDIADELAATGITMVPTLALLRHLEDPRSLSLDGMPGMKALRSILAEYMDDMAARIGSIRPIAAQDRMLAEALLRALLARGVPVVAGSDSPAAPHVYPGIGLHMELDALVQAGLTPAQALQAATINASRLLRRDDLGVLEAGALADITVVSGNPLEDIRASRKVTHVLIGGEWVDLEAAWATVASPSEGEQEEGT